MGQKNRCQNNPISTVCNCLNYHVLWRTILLLFEFGEFFHISRRGVKFGNFRGFKRSFSGCTTVVQLGLLLLRQYNDDLLLIRLY